MGTNLIGIGNYIRNNKVTGEGGNPIHPNLVEFWDFRNKTNDDEDRDKVVGWKKNILNLYNFAYKGNSGYGLYNTRVDYWRHSVSNSTYTDTNTSRSITVSPGSAGFTLKAAVYYIAIYDRSLTQKEINDEIRKYEGKTSWRDDMVLHWEFGNKTNSDYTTPSGPVSNPIIEDLSGNGHHGSLKNFAFEGTSGFGYYPVIFGSNKTWKNNGYTVDMATYSQTKIKINKLSTASAIVYTYITDDNGEIINSSVIPSFKIKVTGIPDNATVIYKYLKENGMYVSSQELTNGVNTLPMSYIPTENLVGNRNFIGFLATKANVNEEVDVTIEILPDPQYNNYLVFDGVDDYVFVDNLEPLTDYTIVMDRKWIGIDTSRQNCLVSKRMTADNHGAIYAEVSNASGTYGCRSFSGAQTIVTPADDIVYVTRDSYNGIAKLVYGDLPDSTHMSLGSNYTVAPFQHANAAIRTVVLFNRTLSKEEIQEVKSELFYENLINNSFTEQIEGLENKFMIYYYYLKDSLATQTSFIKITEDGVYDIPKSFAATTNLIPDNVWVGFIPIRNSGDTTQYYDCDLTIEVLPSLDGCIVTDGIDDYMECSTLPTLYPYYTFIYKRKWLSRDPGKFHYFLSKGGKTQPIGIEHYVANPGVPDYETMVNAGTYNRLPISNDNINFMSDAYYNSFELKKGTTSDADMSLLLGGLRDSAFTNSAIYWLYVYNRTLTNDEIKKEIKRIEDKYYE